MLERGKLYKFAAETPHFDPNVGRCDCRLPADRKVCNQPHGHDSSPFPSFTMITALVDIGRHSRSPCNYLRMWDVHLRRNVSMVIFTEAWAEPFVRTIRRHIGLEHKTSIRLLTKQSKMYFYKFIPRMQAVADRNRLYDWATGTESVARSNALYGWINHQKIDWLAQVTEENPFQTEFFAWVDSGGGHGHVTLPQNFCACNIAGRNTVTVFSPANLQTEKLDSTWRSGTLTLLAPALSMVKYRIAPRGPLLTFLPEQQRARVPLESLSPSFYMQHAWHRDYFDEIIMGTFWGAFFLAHIASFPPCHHVFAHHLTYCASTKGVMLRASSSFSLTTNECF
jgi:hypothetical protein